MTAITLARSDFGNYRLVGDDGTDDVLVQTDYDFTGVASSFGWSISSVRPEVGCDHSGTDGTIPCPGCGTGPSAFIEAAASYLDDHIGDTVEDPGYLS